jgi:hypothetical protein
MGWLSRVLSDYTIPAPAFLHGLMFLSGHNYAGHEAYRLGEVSQFGAWYAYPLGIGIKTPLPFLILFFAALIILGRRIATIPWPSAGLLATIFLAFIAMLPSRVTIGTRHVFVVYPLMALLIGHGLAALWRERTEQKRRRASTAVVAALFSWQLADVWRHHPDWLAYFNPLAGRDPAYVLADSDLDVGQALHELEAFFSDKKLEPLTIHYHGSARLCAYDLPPLRALNPNEPPKGWVAISERHFRIALVRYKNEEPLQTAIWPLCDEGPPVMTVLDRAAHTWIVTARPVAYAGRGIRIYNLK